MRITETITGYSIKYWSTNGIEGPFTADVWHDDNGNPRSAMWLGQGGRIARHERIGTEFFTDKAEAIAAAEKKRAAKIKSLHKQIERIEGINFHA